jgi:hypothetical protein
VNEFYIAHTNIGVLRSSINSLLLSDYASAFDEINSLADASEGHVWRYIADARDNSQRFFEDPNMLINISVWKTIDSLKVFTYKTIHGEYYARRKKWFKDWNLRLEAHHMALWWVPAYHKPSIQEAVARAQSLSQKGPSSFAFDFKSPFPQPSF